jgi:outer membrane protein
MSSHKSDDVLRRVRSVALKGRGIPILSRARRRCAGAAVAIILLAGPAFADDPGLGVQAPRFYVRLGGAGVLFSTNAKLSLAGQEIPGAGATSSNNGTAVLDFGYYPYPRVAISATVGVPPTARITGTGTASPFGVLGQVTYGPFVVSGHYHLTNLGIFQPYLGAGIAYYTTFGTRDGAISNLKVQNALGPVLQLGEDTLITKRWGIFVDLKKIWLHTTASGNVFTPAGPASAVAKAALAPLVISAGVFLRF